MRRIFWHTWLGLGEHCACAHRSCHAHCRFPVWSSSALRVCGWVAGAPLAGAPVTLAHSLAPRAPGASSACPFCTVVNDPFPSISQCVVMLSRAPAPSMRLLPCCQCPNVFTFGERPFTCNVSGCGHATEKCVTIWRQYLRVCRGCSLLCQRATDRINAAALRSTLRAHESLCPCLLAL